MKLDFDWDQWNIQKNEIKHGISRLEAESVFYDPKLSIFEEIIHSDDNERRWIAYGVSLNKKILMCAFTIRNRKVRIISCRAASKKEKEIYETIKNARNN
jgi:uncharacterized DUF497 family protein